MIDHQQPLRDLIEKASDFCDTAMRLQGNVAPIWHMITANGEEIIELSPPLDDKDVAAMMMRVLFELRNVVRYVWFTEAWMLSVKGKPTDKERARWNEGLADHPDRIEAVIFQAEDQDCGFMGGHRRIIRPETGKPYLGPLEYLPDGCQSEGRMVGMLPRKGTIQ